MLYTYGNSFQWQASNYDAPAVHTPGNNTVGTTTQLMSGAAVANDVWFIQILVFGIQTTSSATQALINLRVDPAGGTTWATVAANLSVGMAPSDGNGAIVYNFPLHIKAGSSIGFNGQINNATVGTMTGIATVWGRPTRPELVKTGSYITTFGANTAESNGTSITPGASYADGAWVQLGSTTTKPHWWWQSGLCIIDSTVAGRMYYLDVGAGDATNKTVVFPKNRWVTMGTEQMQNAGVHGNCYWEVPTGVDIFGRATSSGTAADANYSMIAYGLGG